MVKRFIKKNYEFIFCFLLLFLILIVPLQPKQYMDATFKGFSVWAKIVLPSLFCFFILTKLLQQNTFTEKFFGKFNTLFNNIFKTSGPSGYIFFMSIISGYPVGTKLISEFYNNKQISKDNAKTMLSFTSTSGPMFILGSVTGAMFNNKILGVIIFASHILSSLLNGLIYRNRHRLKQKDLKQNYKLLNGYYNANNKKDNLNDIMLNTITSVLMVGGFIALSFSILEIIETLKLFYPIESLFKIILPNYSSVIMPIFKGLVELTNGCLALSYTNINIKLACVLLTALITFGGISIHLQSNIFLSKCGIKYGYFLKIKLTQTLIAIMLSVCLSSIFL